VTDAIPENDVLEERSIELLEVEQPPLPDGVSEADAVEELHDADEVRSSGRLLPRLREDVNEADALDQARPVGYEDDDDWR
jgi:hypothetical protein